MEITELYSIDQEKTEDETETAISQQNVPQENRKNKKQNENKENKREKGRTKCE
jgi:hypothetical protein